ALGEEECGGISEPSLSRCPGNDARQDRRGGEDGDESDSRRAAVHLLPRQASTEHRQVSRNVGGEQPSQSEIACRVDETSDETQNSWDSKGRAFPSPRLPRPASADCELSAAATGLRSAIYGSPSSCRSNARLPLPGNPLLSLNIAFAIRSNASTS